MPIDENTRTNVCKFGQMEQCCRYLMLGEGFFCAKLRPTLKAELDRKVEHGTIIAKGDNCEGVE